MASVQKTGWTVLRLLLAALALVAAGLLWTCRGLFTGADYTAVVALNWELSLPAGDIQVYETDSGPSFHGDGTRYHVLEYGDTGPLETAANWQDAVPDGAEEEMEALLDGLNVPAEERPSMAACRYAGATKGGGNDRLYLLLDLSAGRLYLLERFL